MNEMYFSDEYMKIFFAPTSTSFEETSDKRWIFISCGSFRHYLVTQAANRGVLTLVISDPPLKGLQQGLNRVDISFRADGEGIGLAIFSLLPRENAE